MTEPGEPATPLHAAPLEDDLLRGEEKRPSTTTLRDPGKPGRLLPKRKPGGKERAETPKKAPTFEPLFIMDPD